MRKLGRSCAPGLANVDNVDTVRASLPEVRLHVNLEVLAAEVGLSCEKHLNVLAGCVHGRGELGRGHFVGLVEVVAGFWAFGRLRMQMLYV